MKFLRHARGIIALLSEFNHAVRLSFTKAYRFAGKEEKKF